MLLERLGRLRAALRFIGLRGVLQSFRYSIAKLLIERRFRRPAFAGKTGVVPGRCLEVKPQPAGAHVRFEHADLEVRFLAADLVRLTWGPAAVPLPYALATTEWATVPVTFRRDSDVTRLASTALTVEVHGDGSMRFRDASGGLLRHDAAPERRGEEVAHRTHLRSDEHLYGLGNRTHPLNLRGRAYAMWNRDPGAGHNPGDDPIYLCIPVYLSVHAEGSHLVFYENSYRATFTLDEAAEARFEGGALRYYVMPGPPVRAIERYTELTGRPPLPPRWALGYHQSRWTYENDGDVRSVVEGFRERRLPLSAVHLDIDYMDGFRVFTVDRGRFPDLAALGRDLLGHGVRLIGIIDPGVKRDERYDVFSGGARDQVFCRLPNGAPSAAPVWPGWCDFPDFTDPKARAWWGTMYPRLLDAGVSGFWHDMNEPAAFAAWGDPTLLTATRHAFEGRGGDHLEGHNLYGMLENRAGYEALRAHRPDARPFIVSRSGWAGVQRYAWNWTGDVAGTWDALRQTVPTVLGLGLSGIAHTGPDIGGFSGACPMELYVRWLQLASFFPFFRTHSAKYTPRREPWTFGETCLAIAREVLAFRYSLLPYLYTLAWEACDTGHPLLRPLFWPDASDAALWDVQDAFLVGDALLVAPVLEEGRRSREVRLPAGTWHEWPDGPARQGPAHITVDAPLERVPVFVRSGSVIPMERAGSGTPVLQLHVFPRQQGEGAGVLYSDAGDGYGPYRVDRYSTTPEANGLRLRWSGEGDYEFPYAGVEVQVHGMTVRRAMVDGREVIPQDGRIATGRFTEAFFER